MQTEKKQQAQNLFYQTDLNKTQISEILGISRRTLHYWIRNENWIRIKNAATHLPSIIAENCYHILGQLTTSYLSEYRIARPVTAQEVDTLHKLTLTINKLKNRSTVNENMEMFGFFLDGLKKKDAKLAADIMPHIDDYISSRAAIYRHDLMPAYFNEAGSIPHELPDQNEQHLDQHDHLEWSLEADRAIGNLIVLGGSSDTVDYQAEELPAPPPEITHTATTEQQNEQQSEHLLSKNVQENDSILAHLETQCTDNQTQTDKIEAKEKILAENEQKAARHKKMMRDVEAIIAGRQSRQQPSPRA